MINNVDKVDSRVFNPSSSDMSTDQHLKNCSDNRNNKTLRGKTCHDGIYIVTEGRWWVRRKRNKDGGLGEIFI